MKLRRLTRIGVFLLAVAAVCDARLIIRNSTALSIAALVLSLAALVLFITRDIFDRMR